MNAVVNGRFLLRRITGVERYGIEILRLLGDRLRVVKATGWARGVRGYLWEQFYLPFKSHGADILWSPANIGPLAVRNQVLTLHDLSPLDHPGWFTPAFSMWYRLLIPLLVQRVRHITVPSAYVRERVMTDFQINVDRVTIVPGGVDTEWFKPGFAPLECVPERYILFVGSIQPRKNLVILLKAWAMINHRFPGVWLVLAGGADQIFSPVEFAVNQDRVLWLGYVRELDLPPLYANADVFVLPSLDEGYGLPVLEAMACGTPVIAARAGAIPEVAGEAARLFDPAQADELAASLGQCLGDSLLRETLRAKGLALVQTHPWGDSARKMGEVLEKCQ
jgi:glycosyltransferase involved in cell wall biosynthesis